MNLRDQVKKQKLKQAKKIQAEKQQQDKEVAAYSVDNLDKMFDLDKYNECYIVGGGPSLKNFDWSLLDEKFVIAINRAYEVLPNAQIIYFTDKDYWEDHKNKMLKHKGELFRGTCKLNDIQNPRVTEWFLTGETGLETRGGKLKHGRNSTYAAINLAGVHLKFKKIYLLGIDMKWGIPGDNTTSHWHSGHKRIDRHTVYGMMINNFIKLKPLLEKQKIQVINVNDDSNLLCFPVETTKQHFK